MILLVPGKTFAAESEPHAKEAVQRLLDRTPFDQVVLNRASGGSTLEVLPLNLPERPLPNIPATGSLKVRLLDRPTEEYEVNWASVAVVRVFEQILLEEAQRLTAAGKFDEAYDYYARLRVEFPNLPALENSTCEYLRLNALALYQAKQHDRALALLLTLYQRNPTYPSLPASVEAVAGEVIQRYLRDGNYTAARRVLDLWQNQFRNVAAQTAAAWQQRFESAAGRQVAEANQLIGRKDYIGARKAANRALAIWPSLESAQVARARIEHEFPFVTVGVLETSPRLPAHRIDDWAALRTRPLLERYLAEQNDFGAEGGMYASPLGEWSLDESGRNLTLKMKPGPGATTADTIARYVLSLAKTGSPMFRVDLAAILGSVSMDPGNGVVLHLKRAHVRPESLLEVPLPASSATGRYKLADFSSDQVVFTASQPSTSIGPQAIVEHTLASDEEAFAALRSGEVDVLDRIPPWQVERLRELQDVRVESYKLPTVHVLIPNPSQPLLAKREFRRALCFGIDRRWIVDRVLLGGATLPGVEVISGPFPSGTSLNDPIRYAYNNRVMPRPFEPRLAAILATVAWASAQNPSGDEENTKKNEAARKKAAEKAAETPLPELTLAHPTNSIARLACQSIQEQLARVGIPIRLREITSDELATGKVDCDLRYAELAIWEPLADVRQVIGPEGIAGDLQSPYLDAALRDLDTATNWKDVRQRLNEIHEIASHELPVIPLWQTINFFAYRTTIRGIGEAPITLYQNVEQWNADPRDSVATAPTVSAK